jgi:hypothetical protein
MTKLEKLKAAADAAWAAHAAFRAELKKTVDYKYYT